MLVTDLLQLWAMGYARCYVSGVGHIIILCLRDVYIIILCLNVMRVLSV